MERLILSKRITRGFTRSRNEGFSGSSSGGSQQEASFPIAFIKRGKEKGERKKKGAGDDDDDDAERK